MVFVKNIQNHGFKFVKILLCDELFVQKKCRLCRFLLGYIFYAKIILISSGTDKKYWEEDEWRVKLEEKANERNIGK